MGKERLLGKSGPFQDGLGLAAQLGREILIALKAGDWPNIALYSAKIGQKLSNVKVTERSRIGTPWIGAWEKYKSQ